MDTDIIKRETFAAIVAQVEKSKHDFCTAIDILDSTQKELGMVLGEWRSHILDHSISKDKCLEKIKGNAWSFLLERSGVFEFCSIKQRDEINNQMRDEKNLPDFTLDNIQAWFESYAVNVDKLFEDSIKEIFDWLKPWKYENYKTNNKEIIGKRVIKTCMFENVWGEKMSLIYHRDKYIQALDNVFHLMDGKGISKYPGNLVTAIKEACRENIRFCETEYFTVKWYKKGTMHIEFKRLDLLDKVNAKAGGLNLSADLFGDKESLMKVG
jgi:hypothetical protein